MIIRTEQEFTSEAEIVKTYMDHFDSLTTGGFMTEEVAEEMATNLKDAIAAYKAIHTPDYTQL